MRVIFDVNIWVSFCIGHALDDLPVAISHPDVEVFICPELELEFADVSSRPRLAKYIRPERILEALQLMETFGNRATIERAEADFIDSKDNYLLDFSQTIRATYLVTGDQNLLALKRYHSTRIVSFRDFKDLPFFTEGKAEMGE
jgi:putative PIN family toxin of toxin-antitoxin system